MSMSRVEQDLKGKYDEKHAVEVLRMLNQDRKVKKEFCDGTIISNGNKYAVHKCVVSVVSQFFGCSFITEMQEKYDNAVKIQKITPETLEDILDFAYTGIVNVTDDNVIDLLDGAEFAQIPKIKLQCSDHLTQNINAENCLKLLAYAKRYNLDDLQKVSRHVITENFATVLAQDDFEELNADEASTIIELRKDQQTSEEAAFCGIVRWVKHNPEERQSLFTKMFSVINLEFVSHTFMDLYVKSEPLVLSSLECMQHLLLRYVVKAPALSIVVMGGEGSRKDCFVYEINPNKTEKLPRLNVERCSAAACKVGNLLYNIGGSENLLEGPVYSSMEVLDLESRTSWNCVEDMLEARSDFACATIGDIIYVCGGYGIGYITSCEKYDCTTKNWSKIGDVLHERGYHAMTVLEDSLVCVGGCFGDDGQKYLMSVERYDTVADEWKELSPMNTERMMLALAVLNGRLYAIGGFNDTLGLDIVERYDPKINKWEKVSPLHKARSGHKATVVLGRIYVFGGINKEVPVTSIEVYNEEKDQWEICYEMTSAPKGSALLAL